MSSARLFVNRVVVRTRREAKQTLALVFPHGGIGDAVVFQAIVRAAVEARGDRTRVIAVVSFRGERYGVHAYEPRPDEIWTSRRPPFGDASDAIHRAMVEEWGRDGPVETLALCEPRREAEGEEVGACLSPGGARPGVHYVDPYDLLAELASRGIFPQFRVKPWARASIGERLADEGHREAKLVAFHCRGMSNAPTKNPAAADIAAVMKRLRGRSEVRTLLIGCGDVASELREQADLLDDDSDPTLQTMAAWLEACAVFIGGDSGPGHVAAAVGRPVISIVSPSRGIHFGPFAPRERISHVTGMEDRLRGIRFCPDEVVHLADAWLR